MSSCSHDAKSAYEQIGEIPEWDLADRLRKAARHAGLKPGDMGTYLGVGSQTVSRWLGGQMRPSRPVLLAWAMRTGVPMEWLLTGECNTKVCKSGIPATVHVLPVRRPR